MLSFKQQQRQLVLPAWLDFNQAAKIGELSLPRATPFNLIEREKVRFEKAVVEFKISPTLHIASDIFGFALAVGREDIARDAAITLTTIGRLRPAAMAVVCKYLDQSTEVQLWDWKRQIRVLRKLLNFNPRNPIAWVEQARAYTVLGQVESAKRSLDIALGLAPTNRYVLRSVARFYIHIRQPETAWAIFSRAKIVDFDPWLKSCELNLAIMAEKSVKRIPKNDARGILKHEVFYYSELLESLGMMHLINGNDKNARKVFKVAWSAASHNVVTHGEWVARRHFPALEEGIRQRYNDSLEALTFSRYFDGDMEGASKAAYEWKTQEPYSRRAVLMATYLATLLGDYVLAEKFAREGLETNPSDSVCRNNLVFVLLRNDRIADAEKEQGSIPESGVSDQICYIATKGLLHFKQGHTHIGRGFYAEAIEMAEKEGDKRLSNLAQLNLAISELELGGEGAVAMAEQILQQVNDDKNPDVKFVRGRVESVVRELNSEMSARHTCSDGSVETFTHVTTEI